MKLRDLKSTDILDGQLTEHSIEIALPLHSQHIDPSIHCLQQFPHQDQYWIFLNSHYLKPIVVNSESRDQKSNCNGFNNYWHVRLPVIRQSRIEAINSMPFKNGPLKTSTRTIDRWWKIYGDFKISVCQKPPSSILSRGTWNINGISHRSLAGALIWWTHSGVESLTSVQLFGWSMSFSFLDYNIIHNTRPGIYGIHIFKFDPISMNPSQLQFAQIKECFASPSCTSDVGSRWPSNAIASTHCRPVVIPIDVLWKVPSETSDTW